jgi:hypothetical protein
VVLRIRPSSRAGLLRKVLHREKTLLPRAEHNRLLNILNGPFLGLKIDYFNLSVANSDVSQSHIIMFETASVARNYGINRSVDQCKIGTSFAQNVERIGKLEGLPGGYGWIGAGSAFGPFGGATLGVEVDQGDAFAISSGADSKSSCNGSFTGASLLAEKSDYLHKEPEIMRSFNVSSLRD